MFERKYPGGLSYTRPRHGQGTHGRQRESINIAKKWTKKHATENISTGRRNDIWHVSRACVGWAAKELLFEYSVWCSWRWERVCRDGSQSGSEAGSRKRLLRRQAQSIHPFSHLTPTRYRIIDAELTAARWTEDTALEPFVSRRRLLIAVNRY